jgi:hypothetical protein
MPMKPAKSWSGQRDSNTRPPAPKKGESTEESRGIPTVACPFRPRRVNGLAHESERARDLSAYREVMPWAA